MHIAITNPSIEKKDLSYKGETLIGTIVVSGDFVDFDAILADGYNIYVDGIKFKQDK